MKIRPIKSFLHRSAMLLLVLLTTATAWAQNVVDLSTLKTDYTAKDGDVLTGNLSVHKIVIVGATVTLRDVRITNKIVCSGGVTIILEGSNKVVKGIFVEKNMLTINGTGSLSVSADENCAAIGGNEKCISGDIIINGGIITASGGKNAAGIGGGSIGYKNITINGGKIVATGGENGAGIGGGYRIGSGNYANSIIINGGDITAHGYGGAAGIGNGKGDCYCKYITITGGIVYAYGSTHAASIGCGIGKGSGEDSNNKCHEITIGSDITRIYAKTIGAGNDSYCRKLSIAPELLRVDNYFYGPSAIAKLTKEGFGTYYNCTYDLQLAKGMKAMIVSAKGDEGALTYETIADGNTSDKIVPATTAVMLQVAPSSDVQTLGLKLVSPSAAAITQTNLLKGSDVVATTTGDGKHYKLSYNQSGNALGWYWGADNGAAFTSGAHKAWLALPSSVLLSRGYFGLPGDGETTEIIELKNANDDELKSDDAWYSLDGRKLSGRPTVKGLYIRNGRKEVIR